MTYRNNLTSILDIIPEGTVVGSGGVSKVVEVSGVEVLNLLLTMEGTASDEYTLTVEGAYDEAGSDTYQFVNIEDTNGNSVITAKEFEYTLVGSKDKIELPLNLQNIYIKISVKSNNNAAKIGIKGVRIE